MSLVDWTPLALLALAVAAASSPGSPKARARAETAAPGRDDFDFLLGKRWRVRNTLLKERLAGSTETVEFEAVLEGGREIAGGWGNIDCFLATRDGEAFEGNSLRFFDPKTRRWTIHWVDSRNPVLRPQVEGTFENGVGTFLGEETFQGRKVKLRFLWKDIGPTSARWEQAYHDDEAGSWETNWIMEFELLGEDGDGVGARSTGDDAP
jgi:hypothetical protein